MQKYAADVSVMLSILNTYCLYLKCCKIYTFTVQHCSAKRSNETAFCSCAQENVVYCMSCLEFNVKNIELHIFA